MRSRCRVGVKERRGAAANFNRVLQNPPRCKGLPPESARIGLRTIDRSPHRFIDFL